jgi:hypothetical protein
VLFPKAPAERVRTKVMHKALIGVRSSAGTIVREHSQSINLSLNIGNGDEMQPI